MISLVFSVLRDRKSLYNTLHDRENIAAILSNCFGVIFWILAFIGILYAFNVNFFK